MKVELDKKDLKSLVTGIEPYYSLFEHPLVKRCGSYCGGFVEKWSWKDYELDKLTEDELYCLYSICKESWKDSKDK